MLAAGVTNDIINDKHSGKMKRTSLIVLVIAASFLSGFAFKTIITKQNEKTTKMKKVTGIGGVFFKCKDPKKVTEWYQKHLGLKATGREGFLTTGKGWLALFKGEKPGLDHYCYSITNYDPADAVARLKAAGLAPKRRGDRVYFDDPDGIECQVAGA